MTALTDLLRRELGRGSAGTSHPSGEGECKGRRMPNTPPGDLFGAGRQIPLAIPVLETGPNSTLPPRCMVSAEAVTASEPTRDLTGRRGSSPLAGQCLALAEVIGCDRYEDDLELDDPAVDELFVGVDLLDDPTRKDLVTDPDGTTGLDVLNHVGAVGDTRNEMHPCHCGPIDLPCGNMPPGEVAIPVGVS
jgi:hypothetical protein